jgi:hypothetical protein
MTTTEMMSVTLMAGVMMVANFALMDIVMTALLLCFSMSRAKLVRFMATPQVIAGGTIKPKIILMMTVKARKRLPMLHPMASTPIGSYTGATDHITGELVKLSTYKKYKRYEHVPTKNFHGMLIIHVGYSILHTPKSSLHLNNILLVPTTSKNLLSIHKLTFDNGV